MSSCHWKTLVPFSLRKKRLEKAFFNINNELSQNCTGKLCQIMSFKRTVNWLFNDMWCYLVIAFLDSKIGVFQQKLV